MTALSALIDQGLIGAVCVLLIGAVIYLARALLKSHLDRVNDQKAYAETLQKTSEGVRDLIVEMNRSAVDVAADIARHNQATQTALGSLTHAVEKLDSRVDSLKDAQIHLSASLKGRGLR